MACSQCNSTGIEVPSTHTLVNGEWSRVDHTDQAHTCKLCDGTGDKVRTWAFSNGSDFMDWKDRNCDQCIKGYDYDSTSWRCDLERAVDEANMGDGTVPLEAHRRMGLDAGRDCPERVR